MRRASSRSSLSSPPWKGLSLRAIVTVTGCSILSFYLGLGLGMYRFTRPDCLQCLQQLQHGQVPQVAQRTGLFPSLSFGTAKTIFPTTMQKMFFGMARVDRDKFAAQFDIGVPLDLTVPGNEEVLILYSSKKSLPNQITSGGDDTMFPSLSVEEATEHCNTMKVVLTEPQKNGNCIAIMGQWESYHVHKFMRASTTGLQKLDPKTPLRYVGRTHGEKGMMSKLPTKAKSVQFQKLLLTYLSSLDEVLNELRPIAKQVARQNTIIVMVCNHGQSELLINFVCSAKARGFDIGQILLFATDLETKQLAEGLGLASFFDYTNFANMPVEAAQTYGDKAFTGMMMAKVYCVHMINLLGYDLLFQDVDVVWYRNPIDYFLDKSNPNYNFDMYFQDDGAHSNRYAPYSPNTGFYFVRNNPLTVNFFSVFVRMGDLIVGSGSHQSALTTVLNEHVSVRGLRVKIISRDMDEFPGGYHYHRRKKFMSDMLAGKVSPYIFHMSWTKNKDNKKKFFQQMGDFFVNDKCIQSTANEILGSTPNTPGSLLEPCCISEPVVTCHFRDKPSKIPCRKSPPIDKGGASFW